MRSARDAKRGLYGKFKVQRADESNEPGGKHTRWLELEPS